MDALFRDTRLVQLLSLLHSFCHRRGAQEGLGVDQQTSSASRIDVGKLGAVTLHPSMRLTGWFDLASRALHRDGFLVQCHATASCFDGFVIQGVASLAKARSMLVPQIKSAASPADLAAPPQGQESQDPGKTTWVSLNVLPRQHR